MDLLCKFEDLWTVEVRGQEFMQSVDGGVKNIDSGLISSMSLIYQFLRLRSLIRDGCLEILFDCGYLSDEVFRCSHELFVVSLAVVVKGPGPQIYF